MVVQHRDVTVHAFSTVRQGVYEHGGGRLDVTGAQWETPVAQLPGGRTLLYLHVYDEMIPENTVHTRSLYKLI